MDSKDFYTLMKMGGLSEVGMKESGWKDKVKIVSALVAGMA